MCVYLYCVTQVYNSETRQTALISLKLKFVGSLLHEMLRDKCCVSDCVMMSVSAASNCCFSTVLYELWYVNFASVDNLGRYFAHLWIYKLWMCDILRMNLMFKTLIDCTAIELELLVIVSLCITCSLSWCTVPMHASWKVVELKKGIFQAWNVVENDCGHGKSWNSTNRLWKFLILGQSF